jgi:hypothetical protein
LITNLSSISSMYEYLWAPFNEIFLKLMKRSAPTSIVSKRIQNLFLT